MVKYALKDRVQNLQQIIVSEKVAMNYEIIRKYLGERRHIREIQFKERKVEIEDGFIADTLYDLRAAWQSGKEIPSFFTKMFTENQEFIQRQTEIIFQKKVEYICAIAIKTKSSILSNENCKKTFPKKLGGGKIKVFFWILTQPCKRATDFYTEKKIELAHKKLINTGYFEKNPKGTIELRFIKKKNIKIAS